MGVGDKVTITGYSPRYDWMAGLVGEIGKVVDTKERGIPAVRLSGLMDEPFWIAEKHVEAAPSEADEAKEAEEGAA